MDGSKSMKMCEQKSTYQSYLIRIWRDSDEGDWHVTLQNVISGACYHFASLYELYINLGELTRGKANDLSPSTNEPIRSQLR